MNEKQADNGIRLPIEWVTPEELVSHYANNIIVQHTQYEFILSFFETIPPVILGSSEEQEQKIEAIKSIRSKCIARILVNPERMGDFISALQTNYQAYLAKNLPEGEE